MSSIKELSKDTLIYGVGTVLQKIIALALLPLYTRALTPADYGVLDSLNTLVFFIGTIFGLGLTGATSRYFFVADTEDEKKILLYTSSTIRLVSFSIPFLIFIIFSSHISTLLFGTVEYSSVIIFTGFLFYFTTQQEIQSQIFRFYREPIKYNVLTVLKAIVYPISGILLVVVLRWGVLGATLTNLISSIISLVFAYFYFTRKKYIRKFSWVWAKKMLKFGLPLIFTSMLGWINNASNRFFILHYKDLTQIGLYSIGNTFSQPIQLVNMALTMGFGVLLMSLYSGEKSEDKPETKSFLIKTWDIYLGIAISVAAFITIFGFDIVKFITTPAYLGGILTLPFLIFGQILQMSAQLTGNGMTLKEQSKPYFWILLVSATTGFALNFYFIPPFGFVGAAITTIISNAIYFLASYFWSQKVFYIQRSFIKPAAYFLISLLISGFFPFYEFHTGGHIAYLIKSIVFAIVLTLPFIFKIITYGQVGDFILTVKHRIIK